MRSLVHMSHQLEVRTVAEALWLATKKNVAPHAAVLALIPVGVMMRL